MPNSPKLNKFIKDNVSSLEAQKNRSRYGIVTGYDRITNTATVLLSSIDSDIPSEIVKEVICPTTVGIQTVSPEPGRPCWVSFKGDGQNFPVITTFFNHNFSKYDYKRHYSADTGIPNFILNL